MKRLLRHIARTFRMQCAVFANGVVAAKKLNR
jgi:hypothetical protein